MNYKPVTIYLGKGDVEAGYEGWYFVCPCPANLKQGPFDTEAMAQGAANVHAATH